MHPQADCFIICASADFSISESPVAESTDSLSDDSIAIIPEDDPPVGADCHLFALVSYFQWLAP